MIISYKGRKLKAEKKDFSTGLVMSAQMIKLNREYIKYKRNKQCSVDGTQQYFFLVHEGIGWDVLNLKKKRKQFQQKHVLFSSITSANNAITQLQPGSLSRLTRAEVITYQGMPLSCTSWANLLDITRIKQETATMRFSQVCLRFLSQKTAQDFAIYKTRV